MTLLDQPFFFCGVSGCRSGPGSLLHRSDTILACDRLVSSEPSALSAFVAVSAYEESNKRMP